MPGYDARHLERRDRAGGHCRGRSSTRSMRRSIARSSRRRFKERFGAIGDEPAGGTPKEFAATIAKDSAKWADVVKRANVKLD